MLTFPDLQAQLPGHCVFIDVSYITNEIIFQFHVFMDGMVNFPNPRRDISVCLEEIGNVTTYSWIDMGWYYNLRVGVRPHPNLVITLDSQTNIVRFERSDQMLPLREEDFDRFVVGWETRPRLRVDYSSYSTINSEELLLNELSDKQRECYKKEGYFLLQAKNNKWYEIYYGTTYNVVDAKTGNRYCLTTKSDVPTEDQMLIQKILLENDPDKFFSIANVRPF